MAVVNVVSFHLTSRDSRVPSAERVPIPHHMTGAPSDEPAARSWRVYYLLLTTYHLPLTTYYLPLTAYCLQLRAKMSQQLVAGELSGDTRRCTPPSHLAPIAIHSTPAVCTHYTHHAHHAHHAHQTHHVYYTHNSRHSRHSCHSCHSRHSHHSHHSHNNHHSHFLQSAYHTHHTLIYKWASISLTTLTTLTIFAILSIRYFTGGDPSSSVHSPYLLYSLYFTLQAGFHLARYFGKGGYCWQ